MCLHKLTHLLVLFVLLEGLVRKRKADTANVLELRDNLKSQVHGAPPLFHAWCCRSRTIPSESPVGEHGQMPLNQKTRCGVP